MSRAYESADLSPVTVLKREIPWDTYLTARLISDKDLQLIRRYDKRSAEVQSDLLQQDGAAYFQAFLTVLRNVTKEETVQYVLALLDDLITETPAYAKLAHEGASGSDPYTIFSRLLQRTDWFTQEKACRLLTAVLEARPNKDTAMSPAPPQANGIASTSTATATALPPPMPCAESESVQGVFVAFIEWLTSQLRRPSHPARSVPAAVAALAALLREPCARALVARSAGAQLLAPLLKGGGAGGTPPNLQLLYEAGLCTWQLSFYGPAAASMAASGVVGGLVDTVRGATKEKVLRVALLTLKNLLNASDVAVGPDLVELGLPKAVQQRLLQSWEDADIVALLEEVGATLADNIRLLSSWDKYKKEVLGGSLDWTPMHTSESFWVDNHVKFEEKDFQVLRVLLKLLEASRESRTLAVAASDLGHFITHHPHGRNIVADLRGKELVMRLMMHPDAEVQKQALLAVQKILLAKDKLAFLSTAT